MRAIWRTTDRALRRDIGAIALAVGAIGVSFGAIAAATGLPAWLVIAMSLFVFAGGAQFLAVGLLAAGSPVGALLGGLLLNARLLPFGFALVEPRPGGSDRGTGGDERDGTGGDERDGTGGDERDGTGGDERDGTGGHRKPGAGDVIGRSWPARLLGSYIMVDETVAFAIAQTDPVRRRTAYWLTGGVLFVTWNVSAGLGVLLGGAVADPAAFGLDAAFPAGLLALLWSSLRDAVARRVALVGAAVALLTTPLLPAGAPVLLGLTGLAVVGFGRRAARAGRTGTEVPA